MRKAACDGPAHLIIAVGCESSALGWLWAAWRLSGATTPRLVGKSLATGTGLALSICLKGDAPDHRHRPLEIQLLHWLVAAEWLRNDHGG